MTRFAKYLLLFLLFDALVIGGYLLLKGKAGGGADAYQWTTIDEAYAPRDAVEEFIKACRTGSEQLAQIRDGERVIASADPSYAPISSSDKPSL